MNPLVSMKVGTAVVEVEVPVQILSEMNTRDHWAKRRARFRKQREAVYYTLLPLAPMLRLITANEAAVVTLTRLGPTILDSDNLAGGFKACRDEVANQLGIDDGSSRIEWIYRQAKSRTYSASIRIEKQEVSMTKR